MSGFFGIFNRNQDVIDEKTVKDMFSSMSEWNPDKSDLWIDSYVSLGHAMLWNTPESKYEHLPLNKDAYILTMDARIDNREELAKEIELPNRPLSEIGDSEFILGAYKKWGEECPQYLLGDFSFALWDKKKKQFFCARDHIGIKSFYYYLNDDLFVFATDIITLLNNQDIPRKLDKNILAEFVKSNHPHSKHSTFFEYIKKLPPANSMIVSINETTQTKYWSIENSPSLRYETYEEYVDHLKNLYDSAVEVRLRTDYSTASHMSGGIDSSPIAVLASRKLKKIGKPLHTFNWIDIPEDERRYEYEAWNFSRRIAAEEDNIIHEEFSIKPSYMAYCYKNHNIFTQGTMYFWEENYILDQLDKLNTRVMLSGWGGDELISYNGFSYISGLFDQRKIVTAFYYLLQEKKYFDYSLIKMMKVTLKALFPKLIEAVQKFKSHKGDVHKVNRYKYLSKKFGTFVRSYKESKMPSVRGVRNVQLMLYNYGHLQHRIESWGLMGMGHKVEYRYPLLDKRIVEFAVGIPEDLFFPRSGRERSLIKNAVSHLLPSDIVWFTKKNETKINQSLKADFKETLKNINIDIMTSDSSLYICYKTLREAISNFDNIDRMESEELDIIGAAIQILYSSEMMNCLKKRQ